MKIFEIIYKDGEHQWVAATTNIEALQTVLGIEETDLDLMGEIKELTDDKLDKMILKNFTLYKSKGDEWEEMTFTTFLKEKVTEPCIISSTFYE